MLEVVDPGFLATIQDGGRTDWPDLGVPRSGACDRWSLAVANLLVGAPPDAPAIEVTIGGAVFRAVAPGVVGLAGADLGARVADARAGGAGRAVMPGSTIALAEGDLLELPGAGEGARAYLSLPGGLAVATVLGSASTLAAARLGGIDGRALRAGDRLRGGATGAGAPGVAPGRVWPRLDDDPAARAGRPLRILAGPDLEATGDDVLDALAGRRWIVGPQSDRMGILLEGEPIGPRRHPDLLTHGVVPGAIQLLPSGRPVVLLVDAQPTGGYPVPAVVITADLPRLGQLRPGDGIGFEVVAMDHAVEALRRQRDALAEGARVIRADATWEDLAGWSGA
jgi:biotin-dependent carboxylase-like uncharacterized protein